MAEDSFAESWAMIVWFRQTLPIAKIALYTFHSRSNYGLLKKVPPNIKQHAPTEQRQIFCRRLPLCWNNKLIFHLRLKIALSFQVENEISWVLQSLKILEVTE